MPNRFGAIRAKSQVALPKSDHQQPSPLNSFYGLSPSAICLTLTVADPVICLFLLSACRKELERQGTSCILGATIMSHLINVSNRLPITIGETIEQSSGGLVSAMEGTVGLADLRWVGWPGKVVDPQRQAEVDQYCQQHGLRPVYLDDDDVSGYYDGFSNSSLWPVLHYMSNYMHYEEEWWEAYQRCNRLFADRVLEIADNDDAVWIHDYHLMLLPQMLREARPDLRIGFFLHTPFPSFEVFRCQPHREELLSGLLGADQIGFHTFGYLRHFRSTVLRLLGLESEMTYIPHNDRRTHIGVYPIGINSVKFQQQLQDDEFKRLRQSYQQVYEGKQIVLNVERLDYTKGLSRRLQAIDLFLESCEDKRKIVFIFVCVPSRDEVPEYQTLTETIEGLVGQINGRHGTIENTPIHFMHQSVSFQQLCALYSMADVMLVTPLRDGMNLVAKEYVACQQEDSAGVLILSELSGAAEELFSALMVNPFDLPQIAQRLREALSLDQRERSRRMQQMRHRVIDFDARYWAKSFITELRSKKEAAAVTDLVETGGRIADEIAGRLSQATRLGFFLDYEGTLRNFEESPENSAPTAEILQLVERLANCESTDAYIVSGGPRQNLENWFGATGIGLVAEHGYTWRRPGSNEWETVGETVDLDWKQRFMQVFRHFEGTTPGAMVEEKRSSLVWHYRRSDPEFGQWKSQALLGELHEMTSNLPVEIHHGHKIIEAISVHVNKGAALKRLLLSGQHDAIVCAGDDITDETMFRIEDPRIISIHIGRGNTHARYRARSPKALLTLLESIFKSTTQCRTKQG